MKLQFSVLLLHSASAICEYDVGRDYDEEGQVSSGFDYWASWNSTFPAPAMQGVGPLEIPLEEGYRAKDWTIQLRWPHEMIEVECFSDKVTTMDCGGAGCVFPESHHHITPHFWDANVGTLGVQLMPSWPLEYEDVWPELSGPVPCIDWCDDGKKPEYPGPCVTQPPTTTTTVPPSTTTPLPTTTTTTTTTASTVPATTQGKTCEDKCYDVYFACMDDCETEDTVCQSGCGRTHFNCLTNCGQ